MKELLTNKKQAREGAVLYIKILLWCSWHLCRFHSCTKYLNMFNVLHLTMCSSIKSKNVLDVSNSVVIANIITLKSRKLDTAQMGCNIILK